MHTFDKAWQIYASQKTEQNFGPRFWPDKKQHHLKRRRGRQMQIALGMASGFKGPLMIWQFVDSVFAHNAGMKKAKEKKKESNAIRLLLLCTHYRVSGFR